MVIVAWLFQLAVESLLAHVITLTECVRQQTAGVRAPGELIVLERRELLRCRQERATPLGRVQVARELEHGRVVELRIALEATAGGEDEKCTPDGGVALSLRQRDLLPRDVRGDDQVDVRRRIRRQP